MSAVEIKSKVSMHISYGFLQDNNFSEVRRIANKIRNRAFRETVLEHIALKEYTANVLEAQFIKK